MAHLAVAEPCHVPLPVGVAAAYVEHLWAPRRRSGEGGDSTRDDATLSYLPICRLFGCALCPKKFGGHGLADAFFGQRAPSTAPEPSREPHLAARSPHGLADALASQVRHLNRRGLLTVFALERCRLSGVARISGLKWRCQTLWIPTHLEALSQFSLLLK